MAIGNKINAGGCWSTQPQQQWQVKARTACFRHDITQSLRWIERRLPSAAMRHYCSRRCPVMIRYAGVMQFTKLLQRGSVGDKFLLLFLLRTWPISGHPVLLAIFRL
ncbi:MAG: hypothetical protein U0Y68_16835 [Blastocatellia bacterium]